MSKCPIAVLIDIDVLACVVREVTRIAPMLFKKEPETDCDRIDIAHDQATSGGEEQRFFPMRSFLLAPGKKINRRRKEINSDDHIRRQRESRAHLNRAMPKLAGRNRWQGSRRRKASAAKQPRSRQNRTEAKILRRQTRRQRLARHFGPERKPARGGTAKQNETEQYRRESFAHVSTEEPQSGKAPTVIGLLLS